MENDLIMKLQATQHDKKILQNYSCSNSLAEHLRQVIDYRNHFHFL